MGVYNHWRSITECPYLTILALPTSQFVDDNKKYDVSGIFSPVLLIVGGGELMTIKDP